MNFGLLCRKKTLSEEDMEKEYGRTWIWTAFDPNSRLILCFLVGDRTLNDCRKFFKDLVSRFKNKPLFVSDELPHYKDAIMEEYHEIKKAQRTGRKGRPKKETKVIDPEIDYATVHKTRNKGRVVKVEKRIIFGNIERIEKRLGL